MMLDRRKCADYMVRKNAEQKPGISTGALLWALALLVFGVSVLVRIVFAPWP